MFVRLLCLYKKLFNFKIQKCGQILCVHKPYPPMPGHICSRGAQRRGLMTHRDIKFSHRDMT